MRLLLFTRIMHRDWFDEKGNVEPFPKIDVDTKVIDASTKLNNPFVDINKEETLGNKPKIETEYTGNE